MGAAVHASAAGAVTQPVYDEGRRVIDPVIQGNDLTYTRVVTRKTSVDNGQVTVVARGPGDQRESDVAPSPPAREDNHCSMTGRAGSVAP